MGSQGEFYSDEVFGGLLTMMSLGSVEREAGVGASLLPRGRFIVRKFPSINEFNESGVSVLLLRLAKQFVQP